MLDLPGNRIQLLIDIGVPADAAWKIGMEGGVFDRFVTAAAICEPSQRPKLVNMFANLPRSEAKRVKDDRLDLAGLLT